MTAGRLICNAIIVWVLPALLLITVVSVARASAADNVLGTYPAIFVLGDSLSDTGNGVLSGSKSGLRTAELPYGETFPGFPAGRYSDGHVIVDLLALHLGLPLLNPYLNSSADFGGGVNYAVGGATALNTSFLQVFDVYPSTNLSLGVQLSWHLHLQAKAASSNRNSAVFAEALYVIEIGGNDYKNAFKANYGPSFVTSTFIPLVMQEIHNTVETLLSTGAKHFLFISITPLGCCPAVLTSFDGIKDANGCLEDYNYASYRHGESLQEAIASLRVMYPDASFIFMDYYGAYDYVLRHYEMFGFSEPIKACCGAGDEYPYNYNADDPCNVESVSLCANPSEYIVWDGIHYTDSFHLQIFNQTFVTGSFIDNPLAFL